MDWLMDLLGLNKGKATQAAAEQNRGLIGGLRDEIGGLIDTGTATQADYLQQVLGLTGLGAGGEGMYRDALGLGGETGKARALEAFKGSDPGFDFRLNTGLDALDRRAASRGMLASGNTNLDTLNYADGLASQGWDQWLGNLSGGIDRQATALTNMAQLYGQDTGQRIGLAEGIGNAFMGANNQTASGKEAGQGWGLDLLNTAANVAGRFMGMPAMPGGGGTGTGATGANTYGGGGGFYMGYGGGFS